MQQMFVVWIRNIIFKYGKGEMFMLRKNFIFLFFFAFLLPACSSFLKDDTGIAGTYHGLLPCASCPGIDTWIKIDKSGDNLNFKMVENYLESKDGQFLSEGKATLEKDMLKLQTGNDVRYFLLKSDVLLLLGNSPQGKSNFAYRLYKQPKF